jgi:hypothetical protein
MLSERTEVFERFVEFPLSTLLVSREGTRGNEILSSPEDVLD